MKIAFFAMAGLASVLLALGLFWAISSVRSSLKIYTAAAVESGPTKMPIIGPLVVLFSVANEKPALKEYLESVKQKLDLAGRPGDGMTAPQFLAMIEITAIGAFFLIILLSVAQGGVSVVTILVGLLVAAVTAMIGQMWLDSVLADRRKAISRQFPYFMDLAVMSMEAGAGFQETLETYVDDNRGEELADELYQVVSEVRMGKTLTESLQGMVDRSSSALVQNAILSVIQGERMGTPISRVLSEQAETIRFERSQMAERLAEEVKLKMQGPAMMMLVSILLLVLGPAIIDMADSNIF